MDIFGVDCSEPGLPLCLHHLASRSTVTQHGPSRMRLLSLRLVLRSKSFMLRRNDDPRIIPEKQKKWSWVSIIGFSSSKKYVLAKNYLYFFLSFWRGGTPGSVQGLGIIPSSVGDQKWTSHIQSMSSVYWVISLTL